MKKITILLACLVVSIGFSQELLTNGDFQDGGSGAPWYSGGDNNPIEVVDQGGNFVFRANVTSVTDVWRVNLSQVVALTDNANYELTFDAFTDEATGTRSMDVSLGQAAAPFATSAAVAPVLTSTPQTFTYTLTASFDTNNGGSGSRLLFDMGDEVGFVFIDNVSLVPAAEDPCNNGVQDGDETGVDCGGSCEPCATPPTEAAPTPPARDPADVIAYYSNAYTQTSNWGQIDVFGGATLTDIVVESNDTYELTGAPGEGFQYNYFASGGSEDLSGMTHYHVDIWVEGSISGGEVFTAQLLNYDGTDALESNNFYQAPITSTNQWISVDVPLTSFANASGNTNYDNIKLVQIVLQGPAFGPVYFDNLYFHNNQTLSTEEVELSEVKVFPNPTNNLWNVKSDTPISSIAVYDILGKQVILNEDQNKDIAIDASGLASGVYFARISAGDVSKVVRLIKE